MLLVHGLTDTNVLPRQSVEFGQTLRSAGNTAEVLLLPDVAHGLIGPDKATTQRALQHALAATYDFLDRVLQAAPPAR